jgi:hypothetical protein
MDEIASKTVPLCLYIYERKSATTEHTGRWNCVCYGFHNPFHNKMASADALMRTRFICARSRVKPTTETKNSASNVIRVTLKSPAEQFAEKLDFAFAFEWRSGLPLRYRLVFSAGFSR